MRHPARSRALWLAATLAAASPSVGCATAVKHPAVTAGIVGGALGLGTCKLASDAYGACFAVGGGAGAFLGLVTAVALWLGGDGNTVMTEQQAQPLPELEDTRPRRRRPRPPDPASADPVQSTAAPAPADPAQPPAAPAPAPASPDAPGSAPPPPTAPAPASGSPTP